MPRVALSVTHLGHGKQGFATESLSAAHGNPGIQGLSNLGQISGSFRAARLPMGPPHASDAVQR